MIQLKTIVWLMEIRENPIFPPSATLRVVVVVQQRSCGGRAKRFALKAFYCGQMYVHRG